MPCPHDKDGSRIGDTSDVMMRSKKQKKKRRRKEEEEEEEEEDVAAWAFTFSCE